MDMSEWNYTAPPNEVVVEVESDGKIIQVMAVYGRDGVLPHWSTKDGDKVWGHRQFDRWRSIDAWPSSK